MENARYLFTDVLNNMLTDLLVVFNKNLNGKALIAETVCLRITRILYKVPFSILA
jgi:hypothetical protein